MEEIESSTGSTELDIVEFDSERSSDDEDYDTDLEVDEDVFLGKPNYNDDYKSLYMKACEDLGIPPAKKFVRDFMSTELDLKHYGLMDNGTHAISIALVRNFTVTSLNLQDNGITEKGALFIAKMLTENCFITSLDLSDNRIGADGVQALSEMLQENVTVQDLNVSGNKLKGKDVFPVLENLKENFYLKSLNLNNNNLEDDAGHCAGPAIGINSILEVLNLGWNSIGDKGAMTLFRGLKINCMLTEIDLSHNGISDLAMKLLRDVIEQNENLKVLDLSNNFIHHAGLLVIGKALKKNRTLKVFRIGRNPLQSLGAKQLLREILDNRQSLLEELNMEGIAFDKSTEEILSEILKERPNFMCIRGVVIHGAVRQKKRDKPDSLRLFLNYIRMRGLRLTDLFKQITKDPNKTTISREEFLVAVKGMNIPLNQAQLKEIMDEMDVDNDGFIEFVEFSAIKKKLYLSNRATKPKYRRPKDVLTNISSITYIKNLTS